jgi:hypothetical protein
MTPDCLLWLHEDIAGGKYYYIDMAVNYLFSKQIYIAKNFHILRIVACIGFYFRHKIYLPSALLTIDQ